MSPRPYRMNRRAELADRTRRRIVEATAALHYEKGVAGTTFRDIATRADVGLGTVYHHFATYNDVIAACGAYTWENLGVPDASLFDGVECAEDRIAALVRAWFGIYERFPVLGRIRAERHLYPALDEGFRVEEDRRRRLIAAAFRGLRLPARRKALAFALLDFATYENLIRSGLTHDAAIEEITDTLTERTRR